ncbi:MULTISPECIES: hypothetical protein [Sphaerospermopsis]|uniref:hypothetical protein n=1 Tax=Sphaerospermopsis TaxID=752201 RepID=UPI0010F77DDD|nr:MULTISPECIES: hypothetical protein [Sphaerospermopsis]MBD2145228.1 hypothetical protein [Sphaerospermopsis sp. FACHB-1194]
MSLCELYKISTYSYAIALPKFPKQRSHLHIPQKAIALPTSSKQRSHILKPQKAIPSVSYR